MDVKSVKGFEVTGLSVRTKNADEMNSETAKIGSLWEKFYGEVTPKLTDTSHVFGVYTNYESDFTGSFDVVACTDAMSGRSNDTLQTTNIKDGSYAVFRGKGAMPQAVIDLWGEVWNYFSSAECKHDRAYETDYECYKNDSEIEIYIGIKV